jgi:DNA-directed RNA polymerase subunit beta
VRNKAKIEKGIFFISPEQETRFILAPADSLQNYKGLKSKNKTAYVKKNKLFTTVATKKIDFISTSTNQMISIGTGLIPFIEHNDANRALMGSNMQRQALSLERKETPLLETGIETQIARESQSTIVAQENGIVRFVSSKKVIIKEFLSNSKKNKINKSLLKKIKKNLKTTQKFKGKNKIYFIGDARKSNQNNYLNQYPLVKKKDWVKKGQILVDGTGTFNGKLSLGKNLLVAYMGWEGYNFEDAIVINERLRNEDIFTSLHLKKYKTFLVDNEDREVRNER